MARMLNPAPITVRTRKSPSSCWPRRSSSASAAGCHKRTSLGRSTGPPRARRRSSRPRSRPGSAIITTEPDGGGTEPILTPARPPNTGKTSTPSSEAGGGSPPVAPEAEPSLNDESRRPPPAMSPLIAHRRDRADPAERPPEHRPDRQRPGPELSGLAPAGRHPVRPRAHRPLPAPQGRPPLEVCRRPPQRQRPGGSTRSTAITGKSWASRAAATTSSSATAPTAPTARSRWPSRWTNQKNGVHCRNGKNPDVNEYGIGICLVGNFDQSEPTPKQVAAAKALVAYLAGRYQIATDHVGSP